jgi:hypothetical protein
MKIPNPFLFIFAAILALGAINPPHARAQVSVSFFYNTLDPYGEWVQDPDYGYCWHPTNVDENWAPYTDGYWAYTDDGWTWVSYEDYGGVVYHYGRWAHIPGEGWVWVPGTTWAPAWVSWRSNDDYIGWAPLPPEARWRGGIGFGGWVDARFNIGPGFYSFVNVGDFGAPALGAVILSRDRNVDFISRTTNITNITINNSNVYTGGPSYANISARSSRPIPTLKLVRQGDPSAIRAAGGKALSRQQGNQLFVLAPKVTAPEGGKFPAPSKVAKTLTDVKADHGWDVVKDPQQREQLQAKVNTEGGSVNTPAKAVSAEDLKIVTEKTKTPVVSNKSLTTEEPTKVKSGKNKTTDTTNLENAPATEEPAASTVTATPKTGKSKKAHAFETAGGNNEIPAATPVPKIKKSKKATTPDSYESGAYESETPKHAKTGDSNLQPFMSGGSESKPERTPEVKPESKPEKTPGYSEEREKPVAAGNGEEPGKTKKEKKGKGTPTPFQ